AVRAASPRLRPRLPSAVGHCVYIRREALDLVGGLDPVFSPGYGEEVDFSLRCSARGLSHVCADDVFVFHRGGGSFDENERRTLQERNDAIVEARYPLYRSSWQVAAEERSSPLAQ